MAMGGLLFNELQSIRERVSQLESDSAEDRAARPELGILSDIVNSQVSNLLNLESEVAELSMTQSNICSTVSNLYYEIFEFEFIYCKNITG